MLLGQTPVPLLLTSTTLPLLLLLPCVGPSCDALLLDFDRLLTLHLCYYLLQGLSFYVLQGVPSSFSPPPVPTCWSVEWREDEEEMTD